MNLYDKVDTQNMKLNLHKLNATEITFDATLSLSNTIIDKLNSCFPFKKGKDKQVEYPLLFGQDYIVDNKKHYERGIVLKDNKTQDKYIISISYSTDVPLYGLLFSKKNYKPIKVLFDCLAEIDKKILLDVRAFFVYPDSKFYTALLSLPIKLENNDYFDEIRGIRFTKTQDSKIAYSVIMDRPGNKDIFINLLFKYTGVLNNDLTKNIIKYSTEISRSVVSER